MALFLSSRVKIDFVIVKLIRIMKYELKTDQFLSHASDQRRKEKF